MKRVANNMEPQCACGFGVNGLWRQSNDEPYECSWNWILTCDHPICLQDPAAILSTHSCPKRGTCIVLGGTRFCYNTISIGRPKIQQIDIQIMLFQVFFLKIWEPHRWFEMAIVQLGNGFAKLQGIDLGFFQPTCTRPGLTQGIYR